MKIQRIEPNSSHAGAILLKFNCPWCKREHTHGEMSDWDGQPTHRIKHCPDPHRDRREDYYLATAEGWGKFMQLRASAL